MNTNNENNDQNLDSFLVQRDFEPCSNDLIHKIQEQALQTKQKEKPLFYRILDEILEIKSLLLIPRPVFACALLVALGMYLGSNFFDNSDTLNSLEEYFYYQGALI